MKSLILLFTVMLLFSCDNTDEPGEEFTTEDNELKNLTFSSGSMLPEFDPKILAYTIDIEENDSNISITAVAKNTESLITIGEDSAKGTITVNMLITFGVHQAIIKVSHEDAATDRIYTLVITRNLINTNILEITGAWKGTDSVSEILYSFTNATWSGTRTGTIYTATGNVSSFDNGTNSIIVSYTASTDFTEIGKYQKISWTPNTPADSAGSEITLTVYNPASNANSAESETTVLRQAATFVKE